MGIRTNKNPFTGWARFSSKNIGYIRNGKLVGKVQSYESAETAKPVYKVTFGVFPNASEGEYWQCWDTAIDRVENYKEES